MSERRKIAAILAADIVGFSRMASADEDRTLARLRALRADLIDPIIASQNGRVFKRTGDGALVEFRSVVEAVRCAISVQNAMAERNAGTPDDQRIVFRIGIHLGDVVEESDGDLMGDGVNIAARLEGVAKPGAICLSEDAFRQVKGRLDLATTDLGLTALKNIAEPVRAYSVEVGIPAVTKAAAAVKKRKPVVALVALAVILLLGIAVGAWRYFGQRPIVFDAAPALTPPTRLSIVVLPFSNLSGDASQDYLVDALIDELTTYVSRIPDTFVIARNSAFAYKGKSVDIKQVGRELGVRYALEGSVQPTPSRIRVNAQLIDVETGAHLWAETFDENRADLLEVEEVIVLRLARSLDIQLTAVEAAKAAKSRPLNNDVRELTLQCLAAYNANQVFATTLEKLTIAFAPCEQLLAVDPLSLVAIRALVDRHWARYIAGGGPDSDSETKRLEQMAAPAISADPDNPLAHSIKMNFAYLRGNFAAGETEAERILALNPVDMNGYWGVANGGWQSGQPSKTFEYADRGIRISPKDPYVPVLTISKAYAFSFLGRDAEALPLFEKYLRLTPPTPVSLRIYIVTLVNLRRERDAHEAYLRYKALPGRKFETVKEYRAFYETLKNHWREIDASPWISKFPDALLKAGMPEQ